jgi:hypothetical protein
MEDGRWKMEDGRWKMEAKGKMPGFRRGFLGGRRLVTNLIVDGGIESG